jgi:acyl dehydratase
MVHGWLTLGTTMPDVTSKIGGSEVGAPLRLDCWA